MKQTNNCVLITVIMHAENVYILCAVRDKVTVNEHALPTKNEAKLHL